MEATSSACSTDGVCVATQTRHPSRHSQPGEFQQNGNTLSQNVRRSGLHAVQVLNVKLDFKVSADDCDLLIEKYINPDYGDLVNYVAFASSVDPAEPAYDPYTLGL